ncbi:MAG: large conductance mechanosensitive channel protein MscL [Verrucomicrobiales bacterium]
MLTEFKKFAFKGNLVDMAVGIMIGGAFGTVVTSLVEDILMPLIGRATPGNLDFSERYLVLAGDVPEGASLEVAREVNDSILLTWGNFATASISFVILALVLFLVVKKFVAALQKEEEAPSPEPVLSKEVQLLTEIRDHLANRNP